MITATKGKIWDSSVLIEKRGEAVAVISNREARILAKAILALTEKDNPVKPKETVLKPYRAMVHMVQNEHWFGNDPRPATVTPLEDGRLHVVWDGGAWEKLKPEHFVIVPIDSTPEPKEATQDMGRTRTFLLPAVIWDKGGRPYDLGYIDATPIYQARGDKTHKDWYFINHVTGGDFTCAVEDRDATIAMLSQQLQDKKEIIRKLTT